MWKRVLSRSFVLEAFDERKPEMIALIQNMSAQRSRELRAEGAAHRRAARARRNAGPRADRSHVAIRGIDPAGADRVALERLAGRDSASPPTGEVIGAVRDGRLVAAMSLTSGALVADPFVPTTEAQALLRQRALLLRGAAGVHSSDAQPVRTSPHAP
jgi:hypothetical protein